MQYCSRLMRCGRSLWNSQTSRKRFPQTHTCFILFFFIPKVKRCWCQDKQPPGSVHGKPSPCQNVKMWAIQVATFLPACAEVSYHHQSCRCQTSGSVCTAFKKMGKWKEISPHIYEYRVKREQNACGRPLTSDNDVNVK